MPISPERIAELKGWIVERLGLIYLGLIQIPECPGEWERFYEEEIEPMENLLLILDEYEQMKAGESKCDRCPFGLMLKEYEDDDKAGATAGGGVAPERDNCPAWKGSTPSPGLSEADERALEVLEDTTKYLNRDGPARKALSHLRARLSATLAPPAVNTDTHRQFGPNTDTYADEDNPTMAKISPAPPAVPAWDPFLTPPPAPSEKEGPIQIVFDGPPAPKSGRFVEVEQGGKGINFGEWKHREDGYWVLELPRILFQPKPTVTEEWFRKLSEAIIYQKGTNEPEGIIQPVAKTMLRSIGVTVTDEEK